MVSRLPVFSGKRVGKRVAPEMVLPVFVVVVLFFALLIAYPWAVLTIGTILYLASLPFGVHVLSQPSAQGCERAGAAAAAALRPMRPWLSLLHRRSPRRPPIRIGRRVSTDRTKGACCNRPMRLAPAR